MRGVNPVSWRRLGQGLFFISPWILGFICLKIYPLSSSLYYSLTHYDILTAPKWTGFDNYIALTKDRLFWQSLYNTLYYAVLAVPLSIVVALALAMVLNTRIRGLAIFRTLFYMPSIVPAVAASILWLWIFDAKVGLLNLALGQVGIVGPGWLTNETWAKPALILMSLWASGSSMVIFLAGLQGIPQQYYEAASVDGAGRIRQFWHVTIPLLTPTLFFTLVTGLIGSVQYFTQAYIMTNGGPVNSTLMYALYLFNNAFRYFRMGYASAMAWILFLIVLAATLLLFRTSRRWVHYEGDVR